MHRSLRALPVALMLAAASAGAQTSAGAPVQATVIANAPTITVVGSTNFGSFGNNSGTQTVNPITPPAGKSTATFSVVGDGRTVAVSCPATLNLNNASAAGSLVFTPSIAAVNSPLPQSSATITAPCPSINIAGASSFQLFLGGSLAVPLNTTAGMYSGTFTIGVAY